MVRNERTGARPRRPEPVPRGASPPEYQENHDDEWGRPVGNYGRIYEMLCLEGSEWPVLADDPPQAGRLPAGVAAFDPPRWRRSATLTWTASAGPAIVRDRGRSWSPDQCPTTLRLWESGASLAATVGRHEPPENQPPATLEGLPGATMESKALSDDLRKKGFRFVGPTTAYATMQAIGIVNDHLEGCHFRDVVAADRTRFPRP